MPHLHPTTVATLVVALAIAGLLTAGISMGAEPGAPDGGNVVVAPAPQGEALCEDYTLRVGGKEVPVYACRVSAMPFNQVWPGYQRPLDQTEAAGFAYWGMSGPVRIEVESRRPVQAVVVRPGNLKIKAAVVGNRIAFNLDRPRQVVVEVNGMHQALHLFGNPPETDVPAKDAPGVRYFGPGVHQAGRINLESQQTVYIAAGAVVYGSIHANGAKNIRIAGRGILDVAPFERGKGGGAVRLSGCSGVVIDGIVMRDPDVWCCALFGCREAAIDNVKLVGLWRYNADGIDICNSQDVKVSDSFVRAYDDALVLKGLKFGKNSFDDRPVRNVRFSRCTIWCDWGRAMEIGAETCAPEIADVLFEDCDIVRTTHIAMDIQHGDRAAVHDIRFENIRVEMDDRNLEPRMQNEKDERYDAAPGNYLPLLLVAEIRGNSYSKDAQRGTIAKVLFRNIAVTAPHMPDSYLSGFDAEHGITGVTIEGLSLNGKAVTDAAAAKLSIRKHVSEVQVKAAVSSK
jgi:hypothetical protein